MQTKLIESRKLKDDTVSNNYRSNNTNLKFSYFALEKGKQFIFHYDFGADWIFIVKVQKVEETEKKLQPKTIAFKGDVEQYPMFDDDEF